MPGVFVDEFLPTEHRNTLFAGLTATALKSAPYLNDVTPDAATVFADLGVDEDYAEDWTDSDFTFTLPAPGQSKATYTRSFDFVSGDEGNEYFGVCLYAVVSGSPVLMYAERLAAAYTVPPGGGSFLFQFNLFLQGACP